MAKPEEAPGTPGVGKVKIDSKQCLHCGQSDDLLIHTHAHRHGDLVHEHPHHHEREHDEGEDAPHEHDHSN